MSSNFDPLDTSELWYQLESLSASFEEYMDNLIKYDNPMTDDDRYQIQYEFEEMKLFIKRLERKLQNI